MSKIEFKRQTNRSTKQDRTDNINIFLKGFSFGVVTSNYWGDFGKKKKSQIGLCSEFPYEIRDGNVYCSTLCKNGKWERSPKEEDVKAFRTKEDADSYAQKKGFGIWNSVIPYKEWEEQENHKKHDRNNPLIEIELDRNCFELTLEEFKELLRNSLKGKHFKVK